MNRRGSGTIFCLIAAILFATRYIAAAIYSGGGQVATWSFELFHSQLSHMGNTLTILSVVSLLIGIVMIALAEKNKE